MTVDDLIREAEDLCERSISKIGPATDFREFKVDLNTSYEVTVIRSHVVLIRTFIRMIQERGPDWNGLFQLGKLCGELTAVVESERLKKAASVFVARQYRKKRKDLTEQDKDLLVGEAKRIKGIHSSWTLSGIIKEITRSGFVKKLSRDDFDARTIRRHLEDIDF